MGCISALTYYLLYYLSVWSEMQTCIWPSWCHCHSLSLAAVKSRLVLPFWYRLTRAVPDKGPLNGCVCLCIIKNTDIAVRSLTCHTGTGTHICHIASHCCLPPDKADIPAFTPSRSWYSIKWRLRRDARLSWPSWLVTYRDGIPARRRSPIPVLTGPDVR